MANIYLTLFVILILAYLATLLCRKIGIPRVVGQMSVGILILAVPFLSGALIDTDTLGALGIFANIGIVLLFFFVGLEINFREFKKSFKNSEIISLLHTIVPLSMGFLVSYYIFGFDVAASLVIGIALAVSAEGIAVDFLQEANQLKKPLGKLVITIGALDDMNQFALLTIFFLFIGTAGGISLESLLIGVVLLIIAMVAVKMALEKSTVLYKKHRSEATLFMGALIIIFLFGYLTDSIGIGASIGALVAGMLVRQSLLTGKIRNVWEEHEIVRMVNTVAFGLFVPLFFVWVGLNLNFPALLNNYSFVIAATAIAFVGTIGGTVLGMLYSGYTMKQGLLVGWALNVKGDVELAVAALALQRAIITTDIFSAIIFVALVTTIVSPIVFRKMLKRHIRIVK